MAARPTQDRDLMSALNDLYVAAKEVALLNSMESALGWDQETYMPTKAIETRAAQLSWLSAQAHKMATGARMGKLIDAAEKERPQGVKDAANLREMRRQYERASCLPSKLVAEESIAASRGKAAWAEARKHSEFATFAPHLEKLLAIARKKADLWGWKDEPYDALLENYERGAKTSEVAAVFDRLKPELIKTAKAAVEASVGCPLSLLRGKYPIEKQQQLNREIAESIGFDFDAGRIDTTTHPFCTELGPGDVRLTTRYDERDFLSSLFGVLHETGHGLYEQGLPHEDFGLPSGRAVSLGIHESQSRLWENHVGRSRPFWEKWLPRAAEIFPNLRKVSLDQFMAVVNCAEFSFIRVEADEATYDLHILLRFDLERRMLNGELAVKDIPAAWNDSFHALFGRTPPDDARGCLQDIHWSMGGLGYFATYTLGNLNAAQLFAAAKKQRKIANGIAKAEYEPLLTWLRAHIHQRGGVLLPQQLIADATGGPTDPKWHLRHLRERFLK